MKKPAFVLSLIFIILSTLFLFKLPISKSCAQLRDPWWDSDWAYRVKLSFNNAAVEEALFDHRILVRLDSSKVAYNKIQEGGADIRFTDSSGNILPYQISVWDKSGESFVFVNVSSIEHNNSSYIWMYYGNSEVSGGQDIAGAWTDEYRGVWLFNEKNTIFKDSNPGPPDEPWGDYGTPSMLSYTASGENKSNFEGGHPKGIRFSVYSPEAKKTFLVYTGGDEEPFDGETYCPCDGYIVYYDHGLERWSHSYRLFDNPKGNYDQHHYAQVLLDDEGYLYAFYGMHGDPILHRKSRYVVSDPRWSLDAWASVEEIPGSDGATYIAAFKAKNGDFYILYRKSVSIPSDLRNPCSSESKMEWYEPEYYMKYDAAADSWSSQILIDTEQHPDGYNSLYLAAVSYSEEPEGLHITFAPHLCHNQKLKSENYAFLNFSDDHIYALDGDDVGRCISRIEYDEKSILYNDGERKAWGTSSYVDVDTQGGLHAFAYRDLNNDMNYRLVWMRWDDDNLKEDVILGTESEEKNYVPNWVKVYNENDIDLVVSEYEGLRENDKVLSSKGSLGYYHWDGTSWAKKDTIWGRSSQNNYYTILSPVENGKDELKFIVREWAQTEEGWQYAKKWGRMYGYGANGILVRDSGSTTSPFGRGVRFDNSREDNIRIQHDSSFDFQDEVAVEALVKFDSLDDDQFIFGKSIGRRGFSLKYDAAKDKLVWYIGDGTSYHELESTVDIEEDKWYYIVTSFSPDEMAIWVNGEKTSLVPDFIPDWGTNDLRIGSPSLEDVAFLDGTIGGYFVVRKSVPTKDYILASTKNFIDGDYVTYGSRESVPGDLDGDGDVDSADLKILLFRYGTSDTASDFNDDGLINGIDFVLRL